MGCQLAHKHCPESILRDPDCIFVVKTQFLYLIEQQIHHCPESILNLEDKNTLENMNCDPIPSDQNGEEIETYCLRKINLSSPGFFCILDKI
jgi:hypothetical protein